MELVIEELRDTPEQLTLSGPASCPRPVFLPVDVGEDGIPRATLLLAQSEGEPSASWGRPWLRSAVVLREEELVAVHLSWMSRHAAGRRWHYYTLSRASGTWRERSWESLSDELRARVLAAYVAGAAPAEAKNPGSLRAVTSELALGLHAEDGYILARVRPDGGFADLANPQVVHHLGLPTPRPLSEPGWYGHVSYPTPQALFRRWRTRTLFPPYAYRYPMELALLRCRIDGRLLTDARDPGAPTASTGLTPLEVLRAFRYRPAARSDRQEETADARPRAAALHADLHAAAPAAR